MKLRELFKQISDSINGRRSPRIKLTEQGVKYYDECEKLLRPFYINYRDVYNDTLSDVEKELDLLFDQVYAKADENLEIHAVAKDMKENTNSNKYHIWAVNRVCRAIKEIRASRKGYLFYNSQDEFNRISKRLSEEQERLNGN